MKKRINYNNTFLFVLIIMFSSIHCRKFVQVPPPSTRLESTKIFSSNETATSAINGLYVMLGLANLNFLNGGITLYCAASADELTTTAPNSDLDPFLMNAVPPDHANLFNRLWRPVYNNNYLYTANAIIESLNKSTLITDSVKRQLLGEAKVIRALGYFYLVNLFGDVPYIAGTDFEKNSLSPRTPVADVYANMITDLTEAETLLQPAYQTGNRARINKWTASALLARVYLYTNDWQHAESKASEVINSGMYSLNTDLSAVFGSTSSTETIWQLVRDNSPTADGATFIPSSTTIKPTYVVTSDLLNAFDNGDLRKATWIGKNTVAGVDYYFPRKYKSRLPTQPAEYYVIFRLAELYLIRAEARAHQDNIVGAQTDLNLIRNRAGLLPTVANTKPDLLDAILQERRTELFCEIGHRWFDLKRTGKADAVLQSSKGPVWQSSHTLLPIPQSELDKNPFLTQNPGY